MTTHERKMLSEAYTKYVNGRFDELSNFIVILVGFCLGTLSATNVPPLWNVNITLFVMFVFLIALLNEMNGKGSELQKILVQLKGKYKPKKNNKADMKEIRSFDIWRGHSSRVVKHNLPLLFSALFSIYTVLYHFANYTKWW